MKILHVIHSVNPHGGGPIEGIRQLVPALEAEGIATEVMCLDVPEAPWVADFPVPLYAMGPGRSGYGYTTRAVPWLRENHVRYDAVIVNGLWQYGSFAVWRALRDTTTPYFVYPHGMLDPWFKRHYPLKHFKKWLYWPWAEYRVLRDATAVLFTCEEERLLARESFWLYRAHEKVTGYGIATPEGDLSSQPNLFLAQYPALKSKRLILFLGRFHEKKGCDLLIRAWHQLNPAADLHLVMAGPADHAYGQKMKGLVQDLNLTHQITWTGMVSGDLKWSCLSTAEAFILPSHQENFGISVVEALACGTPALISNKVNIWRELAADQAGLVDNDDLAGTVRLLQAWLALSPEERAKLSHNARTCFAQHFEVTETARTLKRLLERYTV